MAVDCHIHMALDGGYWKDSLARHKEAPDEQFIRKTLETYKSLGFTYLRDGGDRWNAGKRASELAPEYGIRLPHAGLSDLPQGALRKLHRPRLRDA